MKILKILEYVFVCLAGVSIPVVILSGHAAFQDWGIYSFGLFMISIILLIANQSSKSN